MHRQILVNVCKKHVTYIIYYIVELCQQVGKEMRKKEMSE